MAEQDPLIPAHGGYRDLKSFQIAQLIYDLTVRFCDRYIDHKSRTTDQMVQAARSGTQNIAEGSQASGTSKKMELKLTNVARASLEELKLDYEDFLRQRGLGKWKPDHPALMRFKALRCTTVDEVRQWIKEERDLHGRTQTDTDEHGPGDVSARSVSVRGGPCPSSQYAANAILSLLNLCCHFLDRQLAAQSTAFETNGGFTEHLYHHRMNWRDNS